MFLNFDEIKANNPIDKVVERLGINLNKSGKSLRGKCPVCESDGDRNLVVTPDKGVYYCFTAGEGGDAIAMVSHIKGIGVKEAALWLQGSDSSKEKKGNPSKGFQPLDYLQPDHDAVIALGLETDDADRLGIGYAPRGLMKGTVAVPIRRADGSLAGYIGITEAKLPPKWNF